MKEATHNFSDIKEKKFAADIEEMKLTLPSMIAFQSIQAQITRAKFLALIEAGFTRQEAFQLCK